MLDQVQVRVVRSLDEVRAYMASPEGELLRKRVARAMMVAAPIVLRSKVVRATWLGRAVGVAGGVTLVIKVAEALRDWQPQQSTVPARS